MKAPLRTHIEELVPLSDEEWDFVSGHFEPRQFRRHQFVVQKGMPVPSEFWVKKGLLKAYFLDEDGKEHILQFAREEYWTSDFDGYQNKVPAKIFLDCIEDCELLELSFDNREAICKELHKMEHFFRVKANLGYIHLQKRILSLLHDSAEERYRNFIDSYPNLMQRIPKKLLASYLGVSRETLSRLDV